MGKLFQKLSIVILGLVCLGGCMFGPTKEQMNAELKKPEVIAAIEESIKNIDKDAFTEKGVIQSYQIDYTKTYHNPMGGIHIYIYVNDNKVLYLKCILGKMNNKYYIGSSSTSKGLVELLEKSHE